MKTIFNKHFTAIIALGLLVFVALACGFKSDSDWKRELGGKKLTYVATSGSIGDRVDIWFCSSGEFLIRKEFNGFSGGPNSLSMASEDFSEGRWSVESGKLILSLTDGEQESLEISQGMDREVIALNGRNFLVSNHNQCR